MTARIRGEYWIQDGWVSFADGDIGDQNHEMVAINHFAGKHVEQLARMADDLGVDISNRHGGKWVLDEEHPAGDAEEIRKKTIEAVETKQIEWDLPAGVDAEESVDEYFMKNLEVDEEEYWMIFGSGDARALVMKREGWIAVRSNNAELFGYEDKKDELARGLGEILDQEGIEEADDEVEISVFDHKNKRSFDVTLADIKGESQARPHVLPSTTYNKPMFVPPDRNRPMGSESPRRLDARARSMIQTSESGLSFKAWLKENCEPFMIRRSWPFLTGGHEEEPDRPVSRRSRRGRRRSL